jgi:hypothetical protein
VRPGAGLGEETITGALVTTTGDACGFSIWTFAPVVGLIILTAWLVFFGFWNGLLGTPGVGGLGGTEID